MNKKQTTIIVLISIAIFILVYSPHFSYPFPYFIDEWHHLTQATNLFSENYSQELFGLEIGFVLFLKIIDIFTNLVILYKFLPAFWAVLTGLTLFSIVYKKTNDFYLGVLSMIFFASIKSNNNLGGLWFFTPLTFALPFIFLYIYFFTEGIEKQNNKLVLYSLLIMLFLLPIHAISVLFAIPILLVYSLLHFTYIKSEWKFFSWFLAIPIVGILFYTLIKKESIKILLNALNFRIGSGWADLPFSIIDVYSWIGITLALIGIIFLLFYKKDIKKYSIFIAWPLVTLLSLAIFKLTGNSFLSPYQRTLYYFALGLPILSAFGTRYILTITSKQTIKFFTSETTEKIVAAIILILILLLTFNSYYTTPERAQLKKILSDNDYQDILFLKTLPNSVVIAEPLISNAITPITKNPTVTNSFIFKNRADNEKFFLSSTNCDDKNALIQKHNIKYILTKKPIDCNYKLIKEGNNFIYSTE